MREKLKNNLEQLNQVISNKAKLIAVTKKRSIDDIRTLYTLGVRDFGENRVEELVEKSSSLSELDIRWHFIGNLQSKKLSKLIAVPGLYAIHSIDRLKLIELLKDFESAPYLFLQMNISNEDEKTGFKNKKELSDAYLKCQEYGLKVRGLMGMAGLRVADQELAASEHFNLLQQVRGDINPELELSMGMSQDFEIALENGSDWLRIGSYLFA